MPFVLDILITRYEINCNEIAVTAAPGKQGITETHEKDILYSRLSVAWMLQSSLHGGIYGAS